MSAHAPSPVPARALPAEAYVDAGVHLRERSAVFHRSWQLVGHVSQLAAAGDHVVAEVGGVPVIVVRDAAGTLRGFHNVCRHRAGPLAECDGRGAKSLRCRYHGWTYGLDGVLRSAPEMHDVEGFDPATVRLPAVAVAVWRGLVHVAIEPPARPLAELYAGVDARLGVRALEDYVFARRVSYDVACNWKVYVDNYLEGYHVPHIHPALNRLLDYRSYVTEVGLRHSVQWSPLDGAAGPYDAGIALYFHVWPNVMLNILPDRLQTNRVLPRGVDRCRVEFDYYYPAHVDAARIERDLALSDEIQHEDVTICESVQRGLASGSYEPGWLNPRRENAVHAFGLWWREAMEPAA